MNISLTTNCNNHCPYCFQQNIHNLGMEISIENYEKILKWGQDYNKEYIQLLGGEPTLYLKLPNIFEITNNYKKKISIITNLLGYKDNIELITHYNNIGSILINTTYDDNKKEEFLSNMELIKNSSFYKSFSITLMPNKINNIKYINRIQELSLLFPMITELRIGLMTPCPDQDDFFIYNYSEDIIFLIKELQRSNLKYLTFDCSINLCELDFSLFKLLAENQINNLFINLINITCPGPCIDIMPNLDIKYCYSMSNFFPTKNITDFNNYTEAYNYYNSLNKKYQIKNYKCLNCTNFPILCQPCPSIDQALLKIEKR